MTDAEPLSVAGRRVYNGEGYSFGHMEPGDYGIGPDGQWWLCAPNGERGRLNPEFHQVHQHEDGTITVSPSTIFAENSGLRSGCCAQCDERAKAFGVMWMNDFGWHGWLERGQWRRA